ncbi:MAG: sigma-70 family RNA polymerase sigma factor [Planctomycetota bacterium]
MIARNKMTEPSDELITKVRGGDADAMAELVQIYTPRLRAFVERQMSASLRQKVDPDDVLQEVSVYCVRSLPEMDLTGWDPFDWVCQVARRRIMDAGRRFFGAEKRDVRREVPMQAKPDASQDLAGILAGSITTPSRAFSRDERAIRLQTAIEQLPAESRRALQMRYVDSLPTKEIAAQLGKSDGAIRVMLTRSIKKLEQLLVD